jgi:Raf kinase inhibitor-like YbhB/YbcL family protein
MKMTITDIDHGEWIPTRFAFGEHDPDTHVRLCPNRNPEIRWRDLPADTRTLVLICVDTSVPTRADDVNKEGREVPADLPRTDFYHWVMVDIPVDTDGIPEGSCADGVVAHGKKEPTGPAGSRQGLNDYTGWFAGDPDMAGEYLGYDGPCPPWNDSIPHEYNFVLYATDLPRCPVEGAFTGAQVLDALAGHILSEVRIVGRYATNPDVTP